MSCCFPPETDKALLDRRRARSDNAEPTRGCTDCLCLLLFGLALVPAGIIAVAAFSVGNMQRLTNGVDYTGAVCGVGDLEERPYVYYPRLAEDLFRYRTMLSSAPWAVPLYGLCVAECPVQGDDVSDYPCERGNSLCRWRPSAWARDGGTNEWRVSIDTMAVAHRWCVPPLASSPPLASATAASRTRH